MSSDDERDLRQRLGRALDTITLPPAPVDTVLRKGRARRTRRHIAAAAGLAVVVGIGAAVPALVHQAVHEAPVSPAKNPTVTVNPVGPGSPRGLIGSGRINGRKWSLVADRPGANGAGKGGQCFHASGAASAASVCEPMLTPDSGHPVALNLVSQAYFGVLAPDVTRVTVTLADGAVLVLHPVEAYGQRYVAFAVPRSLPIARVSAYSHRTALGSSVPFNSSFGELFATWLRPGQRGLPRGTYRIGSGETVHVGPWGYCMTGVFGSCLEIESRSLGNSAGLVLSTGPGGADWVIGSATSVVNHVRVHLSGGRILTARAVDCGGPRFYAYVVPNGHKPLRVDYYSVFGHLLASQKANLP
jgi:hypothetical protein